MVADGEYTAVLDRFEEGERERLAVLLLERAGEQVDQLVVPAADLPEDVGQDAVLSVAVADDDLAEATFRPEETETRKANAQSRFDRLARRPPGDDDESGEEDERDTEDDADTEDDDAEHDGDAEDDDAEHDGDSIDPI